MRLRIGLLSLSLLLATAAILLGDRGIPGVFPTAPPTPYYRYTPSRTPIGRLLVVHGLNSNKQIMHLLSRAMAEAGFEVFAIDLPGHGDSPAGFEATLARSAVEQVIEELGDVTVLGHSLGAGLLLDLANDRDFGSMVLLSPPPTPVNRIRAERVLVFTGEYDLPPIHAFVPELGEGGARSVDIRTAPWSGHSGAVFRTRSITQIIEWLGGDASGIRVTPRVIGVLVLLAWALGTGIFLLKGSPVMKPGGAPFTEPVIWYVGATFAGALLCGIAPVAGWIRLFATDYLIGAMLVAGLVLALAKPPVRFRPHAVMRAAAAAVYVIAVPGLMIVSEIIHLTPSDGRWWRMAAMIAASLPLFIADEVLIRPIRPWWKAAAAAALTRAVMMGWLVTGVLTVNRDDAFLVLIVHLVILFWFALWLIAEFVRRHTQDPFATALFVSIVHGWVLASMLVTV